MNKRFFQNLYLFIFSWDFLLSFFLSGLFLILIFSNDNHNLLYKDVKNNFQLYIPLLSIFITLFTLSMTILVTSTPDDFIEYLESSGQVFTSLKNYHFVGFFIYLYALFSNIILQNFFIFKSEIANLIVDNYHLNLNVIKHILSLFYSSSIFFTVWSFFYTISLLWHLSKLLTVKTTYYKKRKHKA